MEHFYFYILCDFLRCSVKIILFLCCLIAQIYSFTLVVFKNLFYIDEIKKRINTNSSLELCNKI